MTAARKDRGAAGSKEPDGANLDRIQIVKGWLNADGETSEQVFDVVWSGDRSLGTDGKLPSVGNTVDLETARYRNDIGAVELAVRYSTVNLEDGVIFGGKEKNVSVGINWHLNPTVRVMFNYVRASIETSNPLVLDEDLGVLTAFMMRFQVDF